ncbi:uncharacterized protein [Malus domestica]|uniref:uncharacterized protein n=1 Tax=Malus domestica TaxID=3750 RepID=UPI0004991A16
MDQTKYCAFHKGLRHITNDCTTWRRYLEQLVKEGKCDQYVDRPVAWPRQEADVDAEPPTKTIRINRIFVESEHLGPPITPRRGKSSRPIVDFTEHDAEGVDFPHDDALVISVQLAHSIVDRVMVDNGSSINLLQLLIIQKMSLESTIQRKAKVLTGFNELTSTAIGTITLDVTSPPIVTSQTFMIVSDPSLHNGILSRPCLVKIGAVTSTKYQKI